MIKAENICLKLGNKTIFNNFNYIFDDNKIYCIMGKSGCGKTTLLRILSGLQLIDNGRIMYNEKNIDKSMKEIFMMHQSYTNFPWKNCLDNVLFPISLHEKITQEYKDKALMWLDKVELYGCACLYPHELSGGMKQRLSLARVLMSKPIVILMDEPLSALDPTLRIKIQDLILDVHKETKNTIIMITHDENEAKKMGEIIIRL